MIYMLPIMTGKNTYCYLPISATQVSEFKRVSELDIEEIYMQNYVVLTWKGMLNYDVLKKMPK